MDKEAPDHYLLHNYSQLYARLRASHLGLKKKENGKRCWSDDRDVMKLGEASEFAFAFFKLKG